MNSNKVKVIKVNILGQDYFIKSSANQLYFKKISKFVNDKMQEVIDSGIDPGTQQLKIAVLACMNISDELFSYKKENDEVIDQIKSKSTIIMDYIDENLKENSK